MISEITENALGQCRQASLLEAEKRCLSPFFARLRGYYLLLLGQNRRLTDLPSHTLRALNVSPQRPETNTSSFLQADYTDLPFKNHSIDAIVLPYLLAYITNPERLFAEISRCLTNDGKLFLFGFHKIHPWCWLTTPLGKKQPYWSVFYIKKIIKSNNFEIITVKHCYFGAMYFIYAQKNIYSLTPIRPQWQALLIDKACRKILKPCQKL